MYMNREEAIESLIKMDRLWSDEEDDTPNCRAYLSALIDALIVDGHLTNHLQEGESKKKEPLSFIDFWDNNIIKDTLQVAKLKYEGYLIAFKPTK